MNYWWMNKSGTQKICTGLRFHSLLHVLKFYFQVGFIFAIPLQNPLQKITIYWQSQVWGLKGQHIMRCSLKNIHSTKVWYSWNTIWLHAWQFVNVLKFYFQVGFIFAIPLQNPLQKITIYWQSQVWGLKGQHIMRCSLKNIHSTKVWYSWNTIWLHAWQFVPV